MKKIGFTIGKFAPFHKGHEYLIQIGLEEMDEFYVVIYETDLIDFSLEQRANWIKSCFPKVHIIYAYHPPKEFGLDQKSVIIQMEYLKKKIAQIPVTHFFCSEEYGKYVASYLGIVERNIDQKRNHIPISATKIRNNLVKNANYLNEDVYKDMIKNRKENKEV